MTKKLSNLKKAEDAVRKLSKLQLFYFIIFCLFLLENDKAN